jgi:hypothetical protein
LSWKTTSYLLGFGHCFLEVSPACAFCRQGSYPHSGRVHSANGQGFLARSFHALIVEGRPFKPVHAR